MIVQISYIIHRTAVEGGDNMLFCNWYKYEIAAVAQVGCHRNLCGTGNLKIK